MSQTRLDQFQNDWYSPGASKFKILFWGWVKPVFFLNYLNPFSGLKVSLLRMFGAKIGKGVVIKQGVNIKNPWLLEIGSHVWIGEKVWIENLAKVRIGDHACLSQGAMVMTGNHNYKNSAFDLMISPVEIESGAWVGAKATVCPGVTIHSHAVLSMGGVATKNLEAYWIYAGNPATKVRERVISA